MFGGTAGVGGMFMVSELLIGPAGTGGATAPGAGAEPGETPGAGAGIGASWPAISLAAA